jgi:hypothetical protein
MVLGPFQLDGTGISILLLIAIIAAFVVAFKIMEMIFDTVVISLMSAGFYLVMRYIQGGPLSINDLLLFSFMGASLYMLYSTFAAAYKMGTTIIPLPYRIVKKVLSPLKYAITRLKHHQKKDSGQEKKEGKSTKEVILGEKDED